MRFVQLSFTIFNLLAPFTPTARAETLQDYLRSQGSRYYEATAKFWEGFVYVGVARYRCECWEYPKDSNFNISRGHITVSLPTVARINADGTPELLGSRVAPWSTLQPCRQRLRGRDGAPLCETPRL